MDKLQWFKFNYADWRMGKIQRCSEVTQARFVNLCCLYWSKECELSYEDSEIEIDKEHLDILIKKKIIELQEDNIIIKFLDEQLEGIIETSKGKSKAANIRWEKYRKLKAETMQNDASAMQVHKDAMQNDAEKRREDKRREEKIITTYEKFVVEIKNGGFATRVESLYMRLKLKHGSLTPLLKDFNLHIIEENRVHKTTNDYFINFKNWLNKLDANKKLDTYKR